MMGLELGLGGDDKEEEKGLFDFMKQGAMALRSYVTMLASRKEM